MQAEAGERANAFPPIIGFMRICGLLLVTAFACGSAHGQTYTAYQTHIFAGGGLPGNIAGTSASLNDVFAVALDSDGSVYAALRDQHAVLRLDRSGMLTCVAGTGISGFLGDGGPAAGAQISRPTGLALDAAGNLYIADYDNSRIRMVSNGIITTVAGGGAVLGDGGLAAESQLSWPQGVATDLAGNIYVADTGHNRIRKISQGIITTVAGTGSAGFSGDGGSASAAQLALPNGVAVDASGAIYILDQSNHRVRKVSNGIITTTAGTGADSYSGDGGPALNAAIAIDGQAGIAVDSHGNVFITDDDRIREISQGAIQTVAGVGPAGSSGTEGDNGPALAALLGLPTGVAVDPAGNLYISEVGYGFHDSRVRKVSQGIITTVIGGGAALGDGGPASYAQFEGPAGLALGASEQLYVADSGDDRVRMVADGVVTTIAGTGSAIFGDSGDGGPATSAALSGPFAVATGPNGSYFIGDQAVLIRQVVNGIIDTVAGEGDQRTELGNVGHLASDSQGNIYVADIFHNVVHKISNGAITTVAGSGVGGYSGDSGPAPGGGIMAAQWRCSRQLR